MVLGNLKTYEVNRLVITILRTSLFLIWMRDCCWALAETKESVVWDFDLIWKGNLRISEVAVNQEDIRRGLQHFDDDSWLGYFFQNGGRTSRTRFSIKEALRVGKRVAVSFVNHGYWKNRINFIFKGKRVHNEVYPHQWESSHLSNHFSIGEFEEFCNNLNDKSLGYSARIGKGFSFGKTGGRCNWLPNLRAGLLYEILKKRYNHFTSIPATGGHTPT